MYLYIHCMYACNIKTNPQVFFIEHSLVTRIQVHALVHSRVYFNTYFYYELGEKYNIGNCVSLQLFHVFINLQGEYLVYSNIYNIKVK